MQLVEQQWTCVTIRIVGGAREIEAVDVDVQCPEERFLVEVEAKDAVVPRRCDIEDAFVNADLVRVLQVLVAPRSYGLEVRRIGEQFVACDDVNRLVVDGDAT